MLNKAQAVKRETGENPVRYQSLYTSDALYPSAKAGHWETEKAGCRDELNDVSQKTCSDIVPQVHRHRNNSFVALTNCVQAQENCCGNFQIAAAFLLRGTRR